jgi:putative Mg2+ transporter-C (MgtC) family protein
MPSELDLVLRLLLSTALGATVGMERELTDQPAGLRTHTLVAVGAALFAIVSAFGFQAIAGQGPAAEVRADLTRVISQIVVGIGFLGGGVILKSGPNVRGLTTAATLWVTAAIGTAIGLGMLVLGTVLTAIALVTLVGLRPLRNVLRRFSFVKEDVEVEEVDASALIDLFERLQRQGVRISDVRFDPESDGPDVRVRLRVPPSSTGRMGSGEREQPHRQGSNGSTDDR